MGEKLVVEVYDYLRMIPTSIMTFVWLFILIHVYRGNANKWLMGMSTMLMFGEIGTFIAGWRNYSLAVNGIVTKTIIWELTFGKSIEYCVFCTAHFLLAIKYRNMARNVPLLLTGKDAHIQTTLDKVFIAFLLCLNILAPLAASLAMAAFRLQKLKYHGSFARWTSIMSSTGFAIITLLQCWSGY